MQGLFAAGEVLLCSTADLDFLQEQRKMEVWEECFSSGAAHMYTHTHTRTHSERRTKLSSTHLYIDSDITEMLNAQVRDRRNLRHSYTPKQSQNDKHLPLDRDILNHSNILLMVIIVWFYYKMPYSML